MAMETGVLLVNVGTPEDLSLRSVRRYLRAFLSDRRIIDRGGPLWWLILNGLIIPRRAKKSRHAYSLIWNEERGESPLRTLTRAQAEKLQAAFSGEGGLVVDWAMRYGSPAIGEGIARLVARGCGRILVFPLYPQYATATTESVIDELNEALAALPAPPPEVRIVPPYYDDPAYVGALAESIRRHRERLAWEPEVWLASFHGLPRAVIEAGDPYEAQCNITVNLLRTALGLDARTMPLVYQSRGRGGEWLGPELEPTLGRLAGEGVRDVAVICPGFATDCIETLEEVGLRAAGAFRQAGGRNFSLVPCLNDSPDAIALLRWQVAKALAQNE